MDLLNSNAESETVIEDDDIDDTAFDSERCGICTDVVIDRGVLDCCSHWFCFECIDNWAAITNLCPLCKNEFQLITCLPVYHTIGSIKVEEHSFPRDDDWCVQGNNNTLSFPSYYIDEDAVICLDGDGCKIRSGLATFEEDIIYDTSIACDSCDMWYHAFCVGFNSECTSENSWLCPRCITNDVQQKSDGVSMQNLGKHSALTCANLGWTIDPSFSGKVSVSVADTGETAVVVSMVEGKQTIEASKSSSEMKLDFNTDNETEASMPDAVARNTKFDVQLDQSGCIELMCNNLICSDEKGFIANASQNKKCSEIFLDISPEMVDVQTDVDLEGKSLEMPSLQYSASEMTILQPYKNLMVPSLPLSLSQGSPLSSPCYSATHGDPKASSIEETICNPCNSDGYRIPSPLSFETSANMNELSEDESLINHPRDLPGAPSSPVDKEIVGATENHMVKTSSGCPSELSSLPEDEMVTSTSEETVDVTHQENFEVSGRKDTEKFQSNALKRERGLQMKMEADCPAKKAKSDRKSQMNTSVSKNSQRCFTPAAAPKDVDLRYGPQKQAIAADIMSIVQETDHRSNNSSAGTMSAGIDIEKRDNAAGLRVKKIMRRSGDKKESSILVQKLRKEIREAVQDKSSCNIDKDNAFDAKLLTAFRAAIINPRNNLVNKFDPSLVRVRKSVPQKGKVRENLIKKIYRTSTGRQKRAWDRECEIEFWKHRCKRMKPEKVETLQSVLELLKKATNSCSKNSEMEQGSKGETKNSILSRLYPADTSVFPRKDDIKPLSVLAESSLNDNLEKNKKNSFNNLSKKDSQAVHGNNMGNCPSGISMVSSLVSSSDSTGKKSSTSREASCRKGNLDGPRSGPTPVSGSSRSKGREQNLKELASQSNSAKSDKRKWALEVLARKNALMNPNASKEKQEDSAALNRNYPLLAQLPTDMRPVLAPSHHNKVPVSVRQTQLHRITEHYLRRTNQPVICRTSDTELAVADAVNVENDIFERSNSKLVYVNLCSQFLSQLAKTPQSADTINCGSPATTAEGTNQEAEEASDPAARGCSKVEEALKLAGLSSDSPPNSPYTTMAESTDQAAEEAAPDPAARGHSNVEEALKLAGLSSDSPPNSPYRPVKDPDEEDETRVDATGEALGNVLDKDSHPELDIYGDFEYELEDEGYTAPSSMVSALRVSKVQPENGDSRMKVVLSTLKLDTPKLRSSEAPGNDPDNSRAIEVSSEPSTLAECKRGCSTGDAAAEVRVNVPLSLEPSHGEIYKEPSLAECEELYGPEKEPWVNRISSNEVIGEPSNTEMEAAVDSAENYRSKDETTMSEFEAESCAENNFAGVRVPFNHESRGGGNSPTHSLTSENIPKERRAEHSSDKLSDSSCSISKKVEAYIKEHIRPLCKSGVITVEQYRWAVGKTTDKVMRYHSKAKNANFLIKEGEKVKKLATQYVEAAQQKKLD